MSTIQDQVAGVFERLKKGELSRTETGPESGWEVSLPSGRTVTRSILQNEAGTLIALGPEAVPCLLPDVMNDNPALRYVAIYALEQITGERPYVPYFDQADHEGNRQKAIEVWKKWFENWNQ